MKKKLRQRRVNPPYCRFFSDTGICHDWANRVKDCCKRKIKDGKKIIEKICDYNYEAWEKVEKS